MKEDEIERTKLAENPLNEPHTFAAFDRRFAATKERPSLAAYEDLVEDLLRVVRMERRNTVRATVVEEMENEGVVKWGDEGHRERFLQDE